MAPNRQIRRSVKISSPARNLMGHQRHTQIVPECVCRLLSTPASPPCPIFNSDTRLHHTSFKDTVDGDTCK